MQHADQRGLLGVGPRRSGARCAGLELIDLRRLWALAMPSAWEVTRVTLSVGGAPSSLVRQTGSFAFAGASTQAFAHDLDRPAFQAGGQGQHPPAPTLASGGQDFAVHRSRHAFMNWSVRG